ncbi:MAG: AAA family ATPase [Bacteroidetes bacterium]|nr:AAA family ATPase [Rhodothermia bacterium]MCS7154323.1 AAA family ATPase [Bacteroidota bacterium]MCX7906640.1 AAA family ATPase [Bacteroidota bacterium]MDW8137079.1 ATP-binding protein [Bacteroidota bacterium]MDW8285050.1 ATP-binding protein [Bacteroidota bacterium]
MPPRLLSAEETYRATDTRAWRFRSTAALDYDPGLIGQPRALEAIRTAVNIAAPGYHLYLAGQPGVGKETALRRVLQDVARARPTPEDWVYVNNFRQPNRPLALRLPAGWGRRFAKDLEETVTAMLKAVTHALTGQDYLRQRQELERKLEREERARRQQLERLLRRKGFGFVEGDSGALEIVPLDKRGRPLSPSALKRLPRLERETLRQAWDQLREAHREQELELLRHWEAIQERIDELNVGLVERLADSIVGRLREKYQSVPDVLRYLDLVQEDLILSVIDRLYREEPTEAQEAAEEDNQEPLRPGFFDLWRRYRVNVFVDRTGQEGAPIESVPNPTYNALMGRVEYEFQFGAMVTDYTYVRPGALHWANGGFLLVNVHQLLLNPYAYEALKLVLQTRQIRIEPISPEPTMGNTVFVDPEPIPFEGKVVLMGNQEHYELLHALDPDFGELFRIKAEFDDSVLRTPEMELAYAAFVRQVCEREHLPHWTPRAVGRLIEHAARMVEDQGRLSTRFSELAGLVREAAYVARSRTPRTRRRVLVEVGDVEEALSRRWYRSSLPVEYLEEAVARGVLLVNTDGQRVGEINGLTVVELADIQFGYPARITVSIRYGRGEVLNIQREVRLSGPIHDKGVLILEGYLGQQYGLYQPLTISARIVFEQHYGRIEGDSASAAELCALLSALANVPVRQDLAVTGSVNQKGELQPVGGVNEKIEGFFRICRVKGLTGHQGVIIPAANVQHLMLHSEVREAVAEGRFHLYAVHDIDDCLELLSGLPAGKPDAQGKFPEGSFHARVLERILRLEAHVQATLRRLRRDSMQITRPEQGENQ